MKPIDKHPFTKQLSSWGRQAAEQKSPDWAAQLRILNDIADLITPQLSLEEIITAIYDNVNHLMDAYQFCVGIYEQETSTLLYKGMIEKGIRFPEFAIDIRDESRLASWCIRNEQEIFINDMEQEYHRYLDKFPQPLAGVVPAASLYCPLKLEDKIAGLILVRTIHKNVYQLHHLYILKTVGNFVVRGLALAKKSTATVLKNEGSEKEWHWRSPDELSAGSRKALAFLTDREKEVLFLLLTSLPNKEIAKKLFVSAGTIKTHTLNIYQKMEADNRTSAILKALEWGWFI